MRHRSYLFIYYGYRYGLYSAWPLYDRDVETVAYPVGTANVDIVDAGKKQLIVFKTTAGAGSGAARGCSQEYRSTGSRRALLW